MVTKLARSELTSHAIPDRRLIIMEKGLLGRGRRTLPPYREVRLRTRVPTHGESPGARAAAYTTQTAVSEVRWSKIDRSTIESDFSMTNSDDRESEAKFRSMQHSNEGASAASS